MGVEEADKSAVAPQEAAGAALVEPPFEGAEAPDPIADPGNLKNRSSFLWHQAATSDLKRNPSLMECLI